MPLVSVVIPCYNQGQYINETVDSVLAQTFQDFEIIIVNDGSTDPGTIKTLSEYDMPKTTVYNTTNNGLSSARNVGIEKATGEFIYPLDADDKIGPKYFERALKIFEKRPNTGIVTTSRVKHFGYRNGISGNAKEGGVELFVGHANNMVACSMFRKKCWSETGGYDEQMKKGMEDWEFWIRVTAKGWNVSCIDEPLFYYRKKKESMLTNAGSMQPDILKYIVSKNIDTYKEYLVEAIVDRESKILELRREVSTMKHKPFSNLFRSFYRFLEIIVQRYK